MGSRYRPETGRSTEVARMPIAAQAIVHSAQDHRRNIDRGLIRSKNDRTFDSRTQNFTLWLVKVGYHDFNYTRITAIQAAALLEGYLYSLAVTGDALLKSSMKQKQKPAMASTLAQYLRAAATWFHTELGLKAVIYQSGTTSLLPQYADILSYARKWQQPKQKREPFTQEMFEALYLWVSSLVHISGDSFFDIVYVVFDWVCLGIFTGSRGIEYAQTAAQKHQYAKVPATHATGDFANTPIAFMASDFTIYDCANRHLQPEAYLHYPTKATEIHIRFRYDKSPTNFIIRKFKRSGHKFLCPVRAGLSILHRAALLKVPSYEPIGVLRSTQRNCGYTYLRSAEVISVMRATVPRAYPDTAHYMQLHINRIDCHSNRVTAAVALDAAGMTVESIAFRLRWSPESVKHYLRDCSKAIGQQTTKVIQGHFSL